MNWQPGRQGTGYFKLPIWISKRFGFDVYLLKYPPGSFVPRHTDPVPGKKHYRLNVFLRHAKAGGYFWQWPEGKHPIPCLRGLYEFFRPDIIPHEVTKVESGTRYVLSIGWVV